MSFLGLAALVVAILALRRAGNLRLLERRTSALETEVQVLRSLLESRPPTAAEEAAAPRETPAHPVQRPLRSPPVPAEEAMPRAVASSAGASAQPLAAAPAALARIDWERWLGVRGAAVLGGAVLALAGLFFFRYSIEHGLLPPWLRVVLGTVTGVACVVTSEWVLRERYRGTANALAGGGIAVLYAAFWAARTLYELIGLEPAFLLLVLTTTTCCVISWRHSSLVVALLGLVGGFLTPLMLASTADHPIGLFSYVLLLDGGLLYLAQRRGWPLLSLLSLTGTFLYQAFWITTRMGPDRLLLGLAILAVFAVVFAAAGGRRPDERKGEWLVSRAGGVLLPFAFAIYFAANARFGSHLFSVALLLLLLSAAAGWLARTETRPWIGLGAAAGDLGVVGVWLLGQTFTAALAWEAAGICVLLAATFHVFVEIDPEPADWDGPAPAALLLGFGLLLLLTVASLSADRVPPWPWVTGWLGLAALLTRQSRFPGREHFAPIFAAAVAVALSWWMVNHVSAPVFPGPALYFGTVVAVAVVLQALAMSSNRDAAPSAERAAALFCVVTLLLASNNAILRVISPTWLLPAGLVFGALTGLAATRLGDGRWLLAGMAATAVLHSAWTFELGRSSLPGGGPTLALAVEASAVLLFTSWPFLAGPRLRSDRWAWYAAALAGPAWFLALRDVFETRFGGGFIAALPLALGALALLAAFRARALWTTVEPLRKTTLAWFMAVALAFVTLAIPLQLEKEWVTIGWALEGLAVTLLWKRLDHPGLKYLGLALFTGVIARLVANQAVLGYYPRSGWRVVNWLLYTYLVPAAALLWASRVFGESELARVRPWEESVYERGWAVGAAITGLGGLVIIFVWINLAIADWFTSGPLLRFRFERLPARDLSMSIAWATYALALLALGVRRTSRALRWLSLGLMMATIAKVFLYDLGELHDLYRVASLLGLAISLILISLAYQRFVLRETRREEQ